MERQYFIRVEGEVVEVNEEVYLAYYRLARREKYLEEKDQFHGTFSYDSLDTEDLVGEELIPDRRSESVEAAVIRNMMVEKLRACLDQLGEEELQLVKEMFFDGLSERELALNYGISQPAIHKRKGKILEKLKKMIEN